jgi:transposase InsO family protein
MAGLKRQTSEAVIAENQPVVELIKSIKVDHPFWGYRRVWATLKYHCGLTINQKRVLRLMREHGLTVKEDIRLKAKRTPTKSKPKPTKPNEWWGIDMTKAMVAGFGWLYIVAVLDWYTKKIVGHYRGFQCKSKHWLEALDMAVNSQFPEGVYGQDLHLMSDNGSQPTSIGFIKACGEMGVKQTFTSYNNPKGNADTERLFRTMKEELLWLREWQSPFELTDELSKWTEYYNHHYLHSALGYKSPIKYEKEYQASHDTLLVTA